MTRIDDLAAACAARVPETAEAFHADVAHFAGALTPLLEELGRTDARFAFDRAGRPAAIEAIRGALPSIERELLDAVLEDVACELAAAQEALYRVILAARTGAARRGG